MEKDNLSQQRTVLAAFLEDMRKGNELSRLDLAEKLGITEQIIEEWERGERHMDIAELRAYCLAIDLPLTDCIAFLERIFEKLPGDSGQGN
ncbi:MAG: helix-turn-helix domain-containing protein [Armatimonadota bacterium]